MSGFVKSTPSVRASFENRFTELIAICALTLLWGCSAYFQGYRFTPELKEVALPGRDPQSARALVSVRGVRRANAEQGIPKSVDVRLRLENPTDSEVTLSGKDLQLLGADLQRFDPPHVEPGGTLSILPGESVLVTAWFPFPAEGNIDVSSINFRWTTYVGEVPVTKSATFSREWNYSPYYYGHVYPYYGFYPGLHHHGHHWHHGHYYGCWP